MNQPSDNGAGKGTRYWVVAGMRQVISLPAAMLMAAFVGFASYARESGLPLAHVMLMTGFVWALPAKFVLVAAINAGASLLTAFSAVALSSARLLPMVVAMVPEMRTAKSRTWVLLFLSHFVAITAFVVAMARFRDVPRQYRTAFFGGFACTLTASNVVLVALVYTLAPVLPTKLVAVLLFLTPVYFLCSLWGSARERSGQAAMIFGLALGPLFAVVAPGMSILLAGVVGGGLAYGGAKLVAARKARP